jgi:hypothetical protein
VRGPLRAQCARRRLDLGLGLTREAEGVGCKVLCVCGRFRRAPHAAAPRRGAPRTALAC